MTDIKQIWHFFVQTQDNKMKSLQSNYALLETDIIKPVHRYLYMNIYKRFSLSYNKTQVEDIFATTKHKWKIFSSDLDFSRTGEGHK